jgi:pimeloyl-ACP methyl ester carboxylesterase
MKLLSKLILLASCALGIAISITGCRHQAQDITGNWQGTITPPQGRPQRMILQVMRDDHGDLRARIYSIDQGSTGDWADSFSVQNSAVKFFVGMVGLTYEGTLNPDHDTITGTWIQRGRTPFTFQKATSKTAWSIPSDPVSHHVEFVTVQSGVKLEVLDWGGTGLPRIFVPAMGDTAHAFDSFAPKFVGRYHVYGITPRGFGESSYPVPNRENYAADRLGDDVLTVMSTLNINKPVLISHSIGGEILSSIGSRYPAKVRGLIYMESSGYYMHYDAALGDTQLDLLDARDKIESILPYDPTAPKESVEALLASLPQLEKDLRAELKMKQDIPPQPQDSSLPPPPPSAFSATFNGEQKYTKIPVPILAFFAVPHDETLPADPAHHAAAVAFELKRSTDMANAFEKDVPSAKVVRLPNANHYIFRTNEAEVLGDMNDFLDKLP